MTEKWNAVRYRGDLEDERELREQYRIDDYLTAFEENQRQRDRGVREQLLREGILLSERLSPRIYRLYHQVCERLGLSADAEVFCLPQQEVNAFAMLDLQREQSYTLIAVTAGALEKLEDAELCSVLGHELAHFLFGNNRLNALLSTDEKNSSPTVLPALGESLFLRWRKKAEISADRVGLLASGDLQASARSLLKCTFGLSERNLNLDIDALLAQIDEIVGRPEMVETVFASHPLLPIRLKALELFAASMKARSFGLAGDSPALSDDDLESGVDRLVEMSRRYPTKPVHEAVMQVVALAGVLVLGADRDVSDDEVKVLIQVLHHWFTDNPEEIITTEMKDVASRLERAIDLVNREGEEDDKRFILSRLADVALADGALMDTEGGVILHIAERLKVPQKSAYGVIVGAAQSVGFRTDVKLNRIAQGLRRSLQMGLGGSSLA